MNLTGLWQGKYKYGRGYSNGIIGKVEPFQIYITDKDGIISGICLDEIVKAIEGNESSIEGYFNDNSISFLKKYRYHKFFDEEKSVVPVDRIYSDGIHYRGKLKKRIFSKQLYFTGDWTITSEFTDENNQRHEYTCAGTWTMEREKGEKGFDIFRQNHSVLLMALFISLFHLGCKKSMLTADPNNPTLLYNTSGYSIIKNSKPVQLIGANAFHIFGGDGSDMNNWNMDLAREFVGNVKEARVTGAVFKDANGAYLYPLQSLADSNRGHKRITVICPFGWDGTSSTEFSGKRPSLMPWWNYYKANLQQWALQFRDQTDVWIEVWNEPYRYDRADGYTDDIWFSDMLELVNIIRNAGNSNMVLVPCAEQGQDESVLINKGAAFLTGRKNILFDIHAYEKWLLVSNTVIGSRLESLRQQNLPVIFGETAPMNASVLMDPKPFLDSVYNRGLSVCAWVWKNDASDKDALLDNGGLPNNNNNNNWGSLYHDLGLKPRRN